MVTNGSSPDSAPGTDAHDSPSRASRTPPVGQAKDEGTPCDPSLSTAESQDAAPGRLRGWLVHPRPIAVWLIVAALGLQGLLLIAAVVVGLTRFLPGQDRIASVSIALVVSAAAGAWLLLACAAGAGSGRAWMRGPAITVQVLIVLVGASFLQGGSTALGAAWVVVGVVVGAGILSPSVSQFTGRRTYSLDQD